MPETLPDSKQQAKQLGKDYSHWDDEQLSQSAEMANNLAPEIRYLAGYKDDGTGTYTHGGEEEQWNEEELWEIFWDSFHDEPHVTPARSVKKAGEDRFMLKATLEGEQGV